MILVGIEYNVVFNKKKTHQFNILNFKIKYQHMGIKCNVTVNIKLLLFNEVC